MFLGLSAVWNALQPKKRKCSRCGLYYTASLPSCSHCGTLSEAELLNLLEDHEQELKANAGLGKVFMFAALLITVMLILAFL